MKSGWKTTNFQKMIVRMGQLNNRTVDIGVATPKQHTRPGRSPIQAAQIYQWMEEGTKTAPKRPTLARTFREYRVLMKPFANNMMNSVVKGGNFKAPLHDIGKTYSKLVKHKVMSLQYPSLSPYTIRNRVNSGTTNPLVDTGQLLAAIGYKIR